MIVVFVLAALLVLAAFVALHWWAWRRLVRDTTSGPGAARRTGTVVLVAYPVLMFGALIAEQAHAPFWLQRTLGWPGFLWMALCLYLLLALIVGEAVRPLVRRLVARRARVETREAVPETVPPTAPKPEADAENPRPPPAACSSPGWWAARSRRRPSGRWASARTAS